MTAEEHRVRPLATTYRKLDDILDWVDVRRTHPAARDSISAAEIEESGAVDRLVGLWADRLHSRHGSTPREDAVAASALHRYVLYAGTAFAGPLLLDRRVPIITARQLRVGVTSDWLSVTARRFGCLPDDPAADTPDAVVVATIDELRGLFLQRMAEHVQPILTSLGPRARRAAQRRQWATATDQLMVALWRVGVALGDEQLGIQEASALLPSPGAPFTGTAGFREADLDGSPLVLHARQTCCMHYTFKPPCFNCPRLTDADRALQLRQETSPTPPGPLDLGEPNWVLTPA